jgi:hypothetical protein
MRRLILISAAVALATLPRLALAAPVLAAPDPATGSSGGALSSISLIGTLDATDRPRVFARFDRSLPAADGALHDARVRLVVDAEVSVRGTGVSEHVHTVLRRRLGSLRQKGSWKVQLPLSVGQANRIEAAATSPGQLKVRGTAVQTVMPHEGRALPLSRISGVTTARPEEFEAEETVNGSVGAYYVVEESGCESTQEGCPIVPDPGRWSNPEWDGYENGEDNVHGDLSMVSCNGGWGGGCEGATGGIFSATEVDAISPDPQGTAYFNVAEGPNGITPEMEIAAGYNEHETSSPPTSCSIPEHTYFARGGSKGPVPTITCSQTIEENGEEEEEDVDVAYDGYVVTTVWPAGSNPPSPGG